jgi:hypothetical protein
VARHAGVSAHNSMINGAEGGGRAHRDGLLPDTGVRAKVT